MTESVSNVTATNSVELGTRTTYLGEEYVYCYNAGGADIYPTYGVKLVTQASGYSVANTALTEIANPAVGVCKHATLTAAYYGWIMTRGFTTMAYSTISVAAAADYQQMSLGIGGTFHQVLPITTAVQPGTMTVHAIGLAVSVACASSFYGFVKTGF